MGDMSEASLCVLQSDSLTIYKTTGEQFEEGGFDYKKAIVDSIVILIRDIPDAKENGLLHLCEFCDIS